MALVNDDVGEVVLGIELGEEGFIAALGVNSERLIGGDMNGGIAGVVLAVGIAVNGASGVAEIVRQFAEGLAAQLVAVAQEQSALQLPGIGDAAEKIGRDEGLAGAGGQRKQGAGQATRLPGPGGFLEDGADGRVLVVAAGNFAALVGLQKGSGDRNARGESFAAS